ncbi:Antigen 43 precursor [compost metagenome]
MQPLLPIQVRSICILSGAALIALPGPTPSIAQTIDGGSVVTVPGTHSSPWTIPGSLTVGNTSSGTLQISGGGVVTNGSGFVGRQAGSTGTVTVSGIGAQWTNSAGLSVGFSGTGTLNIANGGHVASTTNTYIGVASNGTGFVTISGLDSQLNSTGFLRVGQTGNGTLSISDNAVVSNGLGYVGYDPGSIGTVTVNGTGARWNNGSELSVGYSGNGRLGVTGGGVVSSTIGTIGSTASSTGTVTVDGTGSSWVNSSTLTVGNSGNGALTIANNATVSAVSTRVAANAGSHGVINIGAAATDPAAAPGRLVLTGASPGLTLGAAGALVFNHTDTSGGYAFAPGITGAGKLESYSGTTVLTADNTYTGGTLIAGGILQLGNGGVTGSIVGNVTNNGILAFNRSNTLTFAGAISGTGAVNQIGAGTTVLTGASTYTGGTTISAGTLQLGNGGATGSIVGNVVNSGTLVFNRSDAMTFAGAISGAGAVNQIGSGTTVLTADNAYTGGTLISAGTLQLGDGGVTGSIVGDVTNNGTLAFNRSDVVPFAGLISGSGVVRQNGTGTTVLTADNTYTGGTTITAGALQLGDGGVTGSIVGDVSNNGALAFNRSDILPFAGLISGSGAVNQNGTGTTVLTAGNTYGGATSVNAGVLQAGTVATFSPNSAVVVAGAGTLDLNGFSQSVAGATNAGLISMGTGTAPGTTLTTPNYAGQGGRIAINTYLGADSSPSDRLVINGGVASGASSVHVTNAGGLGAVTAGNGILIVDAINGGTTMTNAFTLGNPGGYAAAGPYAYTLYRSSVDGSGTQNWYLRSTIDCASAPNNPACRGPTPPPDPTPDPTPTPLPPPAPPNYRPEVSTAVATPGLALRYGETILDSLHERMGEERFFNRPVTPSGSSLAWGRIIGVTGERDGSRSGVLGSKGPDYDYRVYALQSGIDLYQKENADGSVDHAGMYAAFGRATADVDHLDGRFAGQAAMNGVTLGSYWTHIGKEGWYVDGVVQGTRYDVDNSRSPAGLNLDTRGFGFAASLETGYPFRLNDEWVLEPQAQLVFQTINLNDANDGAAKIRFSDVDSLRGRLGVRIARTVELEPDRGDKRVATTWLRASLVNEFLADPTTQFSSQAGYVPFRADMRGLAVQLNLGADVRVKRNVSLYGSFGSEISLQGDGHSLNGKLGLKIAF